MSRVEVYYNLHKNCLSYRPSGGRVKHAQSMILNDVTFAVQPAGREKVRREGKKNVHAFVRGNLSWCNDTEGLGDFEDYTDENMRRLGYPLITYNPYRYESFVIYDTATPIYKASQVVIIGKNIFLSGRANA